MSTPGHASAAAHDAMIVTSDPSIVLRVETDDGWSVSAETPEALRALVDEKLRQSRQAITNATAAAEKWETIREALP